MLARLQVAANSNQTFQPHKMDIIWAPHVAQDIKDSDLRLYLDFSSTACVPGGGCDVEQALQVLFHADGDIKLAMEKLLNQQRANSVSWTEDEVHLFEALIMLHGKNFYKISQDMPGKSVKDCVQFYYLWKKSPVKSGLSPSRSSTTTTTTTIAPSLASSSSASTSSSPSLLSLTSSSPVATSTPKMTNATGPSMLDPCADKFPCRVCGRVFEKIKSRSAHMKRHKNGR